VTQSIGQLITKTSLGGSIMSHFTVMIIDDNIEEKLSPYDTDLEVEACELLLPKDKSFLLLKGDTDTRTR